MHLQWADIAKLALTTGLAAGVFNQIAAVVRDKATRKFQDSQRTRAESHQVATQANELAHREALQATDQRSKEALQAADQRHQRQTQEDERAHQDRLRREQAHSEARSTFLPIAAEVFTWIEWTFVRHYGAEYDVYPNQTVTPKYTGPEDVLAGVHQIALQHPTKSVRDLARKFENDITSAFNNVEQKADGTYQDEPTEDDFRSWMKQADSVIEAIHDPYGPQMPTRETTE